MKGWVVCDKCGKRTSGKQISVVCVSGASQYDPAEFEAYCNRSTCEQTRQTRLHDTWAEHRGER